MQKLKYVMAIVLLLGAGVVQARGWGQSEAPLSSVEGVQDTQDAASVSEGDEIRLRGHIVSQQSTESFVFSDGTGVALLTVEDAGFNRALAPGTPVEIVGDIERTRYGEPMIEIRSISVLASASDMEPAEYGDWLHQEPD